MQHVTTTSMVSFACAASQRVLRVASRRRRGRETAAGKQRLCRASVERVGNENSSQKSQPWPSKPVAGAPLHTTRPPGPIQAGTLSAVELSCHPSESRTATDPVFRKWKTPHGMRWFFPSEMVQEGVFSPFLISVGTSIPLIFLFILAWPLFLDQLTALPPLDQVKW